MISCLRIIEFDAGHRLIKHENKCKYLHGHRYKLEASFTADELDSIGRVIDFSFIRKIIGGWIDENFDHTTILHIEDKKLGDEIEQATGQKIYYMQKNPTAENIATHLFKDIIPHLLKDNNIIAQCRKIILHETPNCSVTVE